MADTLPVTYIHNAMRGAPVLNGQVGSLVALLDAFLITGFGLTTATSVSVSGGIATATLPSGQSFEPYSIVAVDGATPAALNGRARVITASSTSITWATTAPDGSATGTISLKYAPAAGWEKPFSGTNKAVYRSTDPAGSRFYYRVQDTGGTRAEIRGYESMTDVDTGTGLFPSVLQRAGNGAQMSKSWAKTATAVPYLLAADARMALLCVYWSNSQYPSFFSAPIRGFGDFDALVSADGFASGVSAAPEGGQFANNQMEGSLDFASDFSATGGAAFFARPYSGMGASLPCAVNAYCGRPENKKSTQTNVISGNDGHLGDFPSELDGALRLSRCYIGEGNSTKPRANVPGVVYVPHKKVNDVFKRGDVLDGDGEFVGRKLIAVQTCGDWAYINDTTFPHGVSFIDVTGPWR